MTESVPGTGEVEYLIPNGRRVLARLSVNLREDHEGSDERVINAEADRQGKSVGEGQDKAVRPNRYGRPAAKPFGELDRIGLK